MTDVKSYKFESYVWIDAESEEEARTALDAQLAFPTLYGRTEWECTEVTDVEDVVETYVCPSCDRKHPVGFVCEDQVR